MFVPEYMPLSATSMKRPSPNVSTLSRMAGLSVWWSSVLPGNIPNDTGMPLSSMNSPICTMGCFLFSLLTPNLRRPATVLVVFFPSPSVSSTSTSSSASGISKKKFVTS